MEWLHIVIVVLGIGLMLLLSIRYNLNAMLALLLATLFIGVAEMVAISTGLVPAAEETVSPSSLLSTIQSGFGATLGSLAIIVVFGAVIGKLMVDSGAASQIAETLLARFGIRYVKVAMVIAGTVFGLAMFYEVAFIIMAPLIVAVAVQAGIPFMRIAIPAVAATTTAHSLFVPQPGPVALVDAYNADTGLVYIYGFLVAVPTVIITGWVLPRFLGKLDYPVPTLLTSEHVVPEDERPTFATSMFVPLVPVIVMVGATIANIWLTEGSSLHEWVNFFGSPVVAISLAMLASFYFFGSRLNHTFEWVMDSFGGAVKAIAMVVLIIGAGGALKEMIIDTGIGDYIGSLMSGSSANPYIMAWLVTVLIRLATGQGVVSAMTAAGIIASAVMDPETGEMMGGLNPALLVLATAAGSNTLTHVNDASFWLFKGYFDLSIKDTLKTWGLLQLCNSLVGLGVVLLLAAFVG